MGGMDGCRKLSAAFYGRVARDPILRPLFPSLHCAIENLTLFLAQFLGGPCEYSDRRWSLSLREAHLRFKIGRKERDAWMTNMLEALKDVAIPSSARDQLRCFFEESSAYLINHPKGAGALPAGVCDGDIGERWDVLRAVEQTVAAVRRGDAQGAIALAQSSRLQKYFQRDRGAFLSLLAIMSGGMTEYVREKVMEHTELVRERYTYGRTLLHETAAAGSLAIVELLLKLGANPNEPDDYGHVPLYFVGNQCSAESGAEVVRALARGGANVNARDRIQSCTPLHMAARRGNVSVAAALLDCGADIEARDRRGVTPLGRAINCRKKEMAAFLHSRATHG